jgi:hypothetical protein
MDGKDYFGASDLSTAGAGVTVAGPHVVKVGSPRRAQVQFAFAGNNGERSLDMGRRGRPIVIEGRLAAAAKGDLLERVAAIEALIDGATHTLTDNHGRSFTQCRVDRFEAADRIDRGDAYSLAYRCELTQLG